MILIFEFMSLTIHFRDINEISLIGDGDNFNFAAVYTLMVCFLRIYFDGLVSLLSCVELAVQFIGVMNSSQNGIFKEKQQHMKLVK